MSELEAIEALRKARALLGKRYKQAIRQAWFDGNYRAQCLEDLSSQLQRARNTFGPSWLTRVRL
jgi:hypothetical protein